MEDILDPDFKPLPLPSEEDDNVVRLSPTTIATYLQDPALYYYSKVLKRARPGNMNMAVGSAVHAGIEHALKQIQNGGLMPPLTTCLDIVRAVWMEKTAALPPIPGEPFEKHWGAIQNSMFPMVYETLGDVEPEGVEQYFDKPHPDGDFNIHGYIDLIHDHGVITDYKTAAKSPTMRDGVAQISNMHRLQLTYYAWLVSQGQRPVDVEIRTIVKTKVPKLIIAKTVISPKEMQMRLDVAKQVFEGINNKVFTPNFGHWGCGPSKCLFWTECHGDFGGDGGDDE